MHDPEKFQTETIKAITDLQEVFAMNQSRYLALSAALKAALTQMRAPVLQQIRENYLTEVTAQAAQMPPQHQRREPWDDWEAAIDALLEQATARDGSNPA